MEQNVLFALLLSFLAGSATMLGGLISFFVKRNDLKIFSIGMGFSAGVMIFVSFMELLPVAKESLLLSYSDKSAAWIVTAAFFAGIFIAGVIDQLIPEHHLENEEVASSEGKKHHSAGKIKKVGVFTALAMAIHNFPEGLATFVSALDSAQMGLSIAFAVALHNIPEGMAVSLPIYNSTGSRKKALAYAGLSGMAEPVGAILGYFFLAGLFNKAGMGILFAVVAGIMIYISFDELLPTANEYGDGHKEILGVIFGMFVMAISLLLI
ncbi:ZIP family zinc transporter [Elusimicrobium posterum]|uniref:zinc transporter ZupT n=1 Tax=Elusimicrobium posterum TaxID=3116653 RepID=UPI003C70AB1E